MLDNITTEKIKISNTGEGMNKAIELTERVAMLIELDKKKKFHARLLAEEMLSMVRAISEDFSAEYWLEAENKICKYYLEAKSNLNYSKRKELISVATNQKNSAKFGIMEKIRNLIETGFNELAEGIAANEQYGNAIMTYGMLQMDGMVLWSMDKYKSDVEHSNQNSDEWDELEKSIIANIADDVRVAIKKDKIELTIIKDFNK